MRDQSRDANLPTRSRRQTRSSATTLPVLALGFAVLDAAFLTLASQALRAMGLIQ